MKSSIPLGSTACRRSTVFLKLFAVELHSLQKHEIKKARPKRGNWLHILSNVIWRDHEQTAGATVRGLLAQNVPLLGHAEWSSARCTAIALDAAARAALSSWRTAEERLRRRAQLRSVVIEFTGLLAMIAKSQSQPSAADGQGIVAFYSGPDG